MNVNFLTYTLELMENGVIYHCLSQTGSNFLGRIVTPEIARGFVDVFTGFFVSGLALSLSKVIKY